MYNFLKKILPIKLLLIFEPQLREALSLFYIGSAVNCPLCQKNFRNFIALSVSKDRLCPYCGSIERKRLLWLFLKNELHIEKSSMKILHFSPHRYLANKLKSLKNLEYFISDLQNNHSDRRYDVTAIPESDNSFDLVICYHILEHIPDDRKAMKEIYRVLKPGGRALLQVPFTNGCTLEDFSVKTAEQRLAIFGQEDHVRLYGLNDFADRLISAGFSVSKRKYAEELAEEKIRNYVLKREEIIFVCEKQK